MEVILGLLSASSFYISFSLGIKESNCHHFILRNLYRELHHCVIGASIPEPQDILPNSEELPPPFYDLSICRQDSLAW